MYLELKCIFWNQWLINNCCFKLKHKYMLIYYWFNEINPWNKAFACSMCYSTILRRTDGWALGLRTSKCIYRWTKTKLFYSGEHLSLGLTWVDFFAARFWVCFCVTFFFYTSALFYTDLHLPAYEKWIF